VEEVKIIATTKRSEGVEVANEIEMKEEEKEKATDLKILRED
jgi:hypothetical protein